MLSALTITAREGLEASLILSVLAAYLTRSGQRQRLAWLWVGTLLAMLFSLLLLVALLALGGELEGRAEAAYEAGMMALAALILTYMLFWLREHGRYLGRDIERQAGKVLAGGSALALMALAFTLVAREGAETALYLAAASETGSRAATAVGALAGLSLAAFAGLLAFRGGLRIGLRRFFDLTGIVLLLFAAGLVGRATAEFQAAGLFPGTISIWSTESILSTQSLPAGVLAGLVGYAAQPTLLQAIFVAAYLALVIFFMSGHQVSREEAFRPFRAGYGSWLYRPLRSPLLPTLLSSVLGLTLAALILAAVLPLDVGPFRNEGALRWGPLSGEENGNNIFNLAVWIVAIPSLTLVTLLFGRVWCGNLCPLRLVSNAGRWLGDRLGGRSGSVTPYVRAGWLLPLSFVLVTFLVKAWPVQRVATYGAIFFITLATVSFAVGALFRRGTWCRYLCPVGGWLARISRLSPVALRPDSDVCLTCKDRPCLTAEVSQRCPSYLNPSKLESSRYCLACWACVRNCPLGKASLRLGWRTPGAEALRPLRPDAWEALFIAGLLGMYMAVGHRSADLASLPWPVLFFGLLGTAAALYLALCAVASRLGGVPFRTVVSTLGYLFLPLEFGAALLTFGDDALEFFDVIVPAAALLLSAGFVASSLLAATIITSQVSGTRRRASTAVPVAIALVAVLFAWLKWYASGTVIDLT